MTDQNDSSKAGEGAAATGTGWIDQPESPAARAALVGKIGDQQRTVAAAKDAGMHGRIDRGQHQKQLLGAFGTLRIFDAIPPAVRLGPFARPAQYLATCRFSSGQPCPFSDQKADVRGVAIKFFTPDGTETDLLMTNQGGRSHARDAVQFMNFADVLVAQIAGGTGGLLDKLKDELVASELGAVEALRIFGVLLKETVFHKVESLATESYWGSVVRLGDAAVKVSLQPHPSTASGTKSDPEGDEYLREDMLARLAAGPVRFRLCIQLFTDEDATPVNDASVAWRTPPVAIGELEIQGASAEEDERTINRLAFNPANGFAPLGITHARGDVYAASAAARAEPALTSDEVRRLFAAHS